MRKNKVVLTLNLDEELDKCFREACVDADRSMADQVTHLIKKWLRERSEKSAIPNVPAKRKWTPRETAGPRPKEKYAGKLPQTPAHE